MIVINNTNYLNDECVEEYVERNQDRLYNSKTGMLQIPIPVGYLTLSIDDVDITTNTTYVVVTLEFKNMGRLD